MNAEAQRAEAEGMFLVIQEKERQLAQVSLSCGRTTALGKDISFHERYNGLFMTPPCRGYSPTPANVKTKRLRTKLKD